MVFNCVSKAVSQYIVFCFDMFGLSPKVYLRIFGIQQAACMSYLYCFRVETVLKMNNTCRAKHVLYIKTTPKPCCNVAPNVVCFAT